MAKYIVIFLASLLFFSCNKKSEISKVFNCETATFNHLEKVDDVKTLFSIDLPKDWKINLYTDVVQSSIFTADTTKQLTETVLLDVTYISNKINFDEAFLLQQEQEHLAKNLIKTKSKRVVFLEKPSLLMQFKGIKGQFPYQVSNLFIKLNNSNFILAKTEIYGDSLVNQRLCKAFSLLEKMHIKE
ncbi:hypothetical protein [Polaribacter sp. R77954]|uniref:hypothetical protein n=1 Tax=Polaribacter sp. R77954 TaxID=3093870 RepID=UPI0037C7E7C4